MFNPDGDQTQQPHLFNARKKNLIELNIESMNEMLAHLPASEEKLIQTLCARRQEDMSVAMLVYFNGGLTAAPFNFQNYHNFIEKIKTCSGRLKDIVDNLFRVLWALYNLPGVFPMTTDKVTLYEEFQQFIEGPKPVVHTAAPPAQVENTPLSALNTFLDEHTTSQVFSMKGAYTRQGIFLSTLIFLITENNFGSEQARQDLVNKLVADKSTLYRRPTTLTKIKEAHAKDAFYMILKNKNNTGYFSGIVSNQREKLTAQILAATDVGRELPPHLEFYGFVKKHFDALQPNKRSSEANMAVFLNICAALFTFEKNATQLKEPNKAYSKLYRAINIVLTKSKEEKEQKKAYEKFLSILEGDFHGRYFPFGKDKKDLPSWKTDKMLIVEMFKHFEQTEKSNLPNWMTP